MWQSRWIELLFLEKKNLHYKKETKLYAIQNIAKLLFHYSKIRFIITIKILKIVVTNSGTNTLVLNFISYKKKDVMSNIYFIATFILYFKPNKYFKKYFYLKEFLRFLVIFTDLSFKIVIHYLYFFNFYFPEILLFSLLRKRNPYKLFLSSMMLWGLFFF